MFRLNDKLAAIGEKYNNNKFLEPRNESTEFYCAVKFFFGSFLWSVFGTYCWAKNLQGGVSGSIFKMTHDSRPHSPPRGDDNFFNNNRFFFIYDFRGTTGGLENSK